MQSVWDFFGIGASMADNLIAGAIFFVLEVIAVVWLLRHIENRRWRPARKAVATEFQRALHELAFVGNTFELDMRAHGAKKEMPDEVRQGKFRAAVNGLHGKGTAIHQSLVGKMAMYAPAMTAEQMACVTEAIDAFDSLRVSLTDCKDMSGVWFFASQDELSDRVADANRKAKAVVEKLSKLNRLSGLNANAGAFETQELDSEGNDVSVERDIAELTGERAEWFAAQWTSSFKWAFGYHLPKTSADALMGGMQKMTPEERELADAPF
jgi:hypothetical protein